jgi:hypothetical protein
MSGKVAMSRSRAVEASTTVVFLWRRKNPKVLRGRVSIALDVADFFIFITMNEGYLHLWGKNYPNPTLIKNKVTLVAAGENHILFVGS